MCATTMQMKVKRVFGVPVLGIMAVLGGFLLQFTMGAFYSFGNMMTYMTSYMRQNGSPNITYEDFVVVQSTWGMTQGTIMPLSGFLIRLVGERIAMTAGAVIFSGGCALTYLTIDKELWMVAATYGFVSAFGQNIALIPTLTTAMKWFPNRKGTAMGIVVGGFGGGAFVFNQIQTAIVNPENISPAKNGTDEGYFTDPAVLSRLPNLLLILAGIYVVMGLTGALLIWQPPSWWLSTEMSDVVDDEEDYVTWQEAFKRKELYLLWLTRLCVVLITQVISALYKAFGQTFIYDDHFLSMVGSVCAVFNCTGRLFYGLIMDKTAYRVSMSIEATLLTLLMSTLYLTSMIGTCPEEEGCSETSTLTKVVFAIWIWAIYFTFPGTYSTQPAVTIQTFGHKYGGMIYAFLFSSDIVNNLMVATLSKTLKESLGYLGLFLVVAAFGVAALIITQFYPYRPAPGPRPDRKKNNTVDDDDPASTTTEVSTNL